MSVSGSRNWHKYVSFWPQKQKLTFHVRNWCLAPETDVLCQFLGPETDPFCQFLDPEIFEPETDVLCQFLDPETVIMGQFLEPEMTFSGARNWSIITVSGKWKIGRLLPAVISNYKISCMVTWDSNPRKLKSKKCLSKRHFSKGRDSCPRKHWSKETLSPRIF